MKRTTARFFLMTVAPVLLCAILTVCGGSPAHVSTADELDAAIREASTYLNGKVPKGSKAVFLNIKSDYPDLSEYILSVLSENAVNDSVFSVVERQQLDLIRTELNFQMSGEVSDESAQSIGQMLGAQSIVSGAVSKIGSLYRIQVKAIAVQTAGVQGQWSRNVPTGATIAALTEKYAPAPVGTAAASGTGGGGNRTSAPVQAVPAQAPAPAPTPAPVPAPAPATPTTYNVGDKGPAGGWIFYDKGVFTNGWRYMEAAPNDIGPAQWGVRNIEVDGTSTAVGTGRANTQCIISELEQSGEDGAALLCTAMNINGLTGWFLPSKDELNLMYVNLKTKGLGGFGSGLYWSSSQAFSGGFLNLDRNKAFAQNFRNGSEERYEKNGTSSVRPVRQF